MAVCDNRIDALASLWESVGYAVHRDVSERVPVLAWTKRKPIVPLGKCRDVWVVCHIDTTDSFTKRDLRRMVERLVAPRLLDIILMDPFVNVVAIGNNIDTEHQVKRFSPDRTRHWRSTFYTVIACDLSCGKIASRKTWTRSLMAGAMMQCVAQVLSGGELSHEAQEMLRRHNCGTT